MTLPFTVSALLYKFIISNGSYRSICSSVRDYLWVMSSGMELVCYLSWLVHFTQCLFVATAQERQQASKWDLYPEYCQSLPRCLPSIVFQQWKHPRFTEFFFYTNNLLLPTWMFVRDFFFFILWNSDLFPRMCLNIGFVSLMPLLLSETLRSADWTLSLV